MPTVPAVTKNRFDSFFSNPVYRAYKNRFYNFKVRKERILGALDPACPGWSLEIGSGLSTITPAAGGVLYTDVSEQAMSALAGSQDGHFAVMSATDLAVRPGSVGRVVCSEVLEHIQDDARALSEIARILAPGGQFLMTVPVNPSLYGADDRLVEHCRRYDVRTLRPRLEAAGFSVERIIPVTGLLDKAAWLLAATVYKWFFAVSPAKRGGAESAGPVRKDYFLPVYLALNWIYGWLVRAEAAVIPSNWATCVLAVCRKKV